MWIPPVCWGTGTQRKGRKWCVHPTPRLPAYDDFGRKCCSMAVCKAARQKPPTDDLQEWEAKRNGAAGHRAPQERRSREHSAPPLALLLIRRPSASTRGPASLSISHSLVYAFIHFFIALYFNSLVCAFNHLFIKFLITRIANVYWANSCRLDVLGSFGKVSSLISIKNLTTTAPAFTEQVFCVTHHELSHFILTKVIWGKMLFLTAFFRDWVKCFRRFR